jgi:hypothetical protein
MIQGDHFVCQYCSPSIPRHESGAGPLARDFCTSGFPTNLDQGVAAAPGFWVDLSNHEDSSSLSNSATLSSFSSFTVRSSEGWWPSHLFASSVLF